jgi:FMN reductase (NADPH)
MTLSNPVLELIHRHASVRHYKPDPLPREMIEAIVRAAQRASTSSNLQTWSVIAVTDPARRERLAALCGDQKHIAEAPLFLAWCADLARLERVCELRGYVQVTRYVENFLIAGPGCGDCGANRSPGRRIHGLGICYIGAIRNNPGEVIELLKLPRLTFRSSV